MKISILYADWELLRDQAEVSRLAGGGLLDDPFWAVTWEGKDLLDSNPMAYSTVWEGSREGLAGPGSKDIDQDILNELWERFNIGDRGGKRIRSMCVGDQVWIADRKWVCQKVGWERCDRNVAPPEIRKIQPDV
jgi:hypothetical protein